LTSGSVASGATSTYTTAVTATGATAPATVTNSTMFDESALLTDAGDASPSSESGLSQAAVVAIAAIVPTCLLCGVLLCVLGYKFGTRRDAKHGRAQVLSTAGASAANFDKEFQSSRDIQSIYGPAPPALGAAAEYELVCEGDLLPATVVGQQIYTAAPSPAAAARSAAAAGAYDRVPAARNVYDSANSKLTV
jgi:hypothetical protein